MNSTAIQTIAQGLDTKQYPLQEMNFKPTQEQLYECLMRPESQELLSAMPRNIGGAFLCLYYGVSTSFDDDVMFVREWFLANSELSRIVKKFPSSAHSFRTLYQEPGCEGKGIVDPYFAKGSAGLKIFARLQAVKRYLKNKIPALYQEKGRRIKIDDIAAGDSRALTELLEENPELIKMVDIRSIDIDDTIIKVLENRLNELDARAETKGIRQVFELCCMPVVKALGSCRDADIVLLVGVICGMSGEDSLKPLLSAFYFAGPEATLIVSAAQVEMGTGDPLTVLIMYIMGWIMRLKTTDYTCDLVRQAGWTPTTGSFYESDLHHHIMVVAKK